MGNTTCRSFPVIIPIITPEITKTGVYAQTTWFNKMLAPNSCPILWKIPPKQLVKKAEQWNSFAKSSMIRREHIPPHAPKNAAVTPLVSKAKPNFNSNRIPLYPVPR